MPSKGNPQNLNPVRTTKEATELGRKGGIASGEARRKRKTLKEELLLMLEDEKVQKSITLALIERAKQGDVKAYKALEESIGEKQTDKQEIDISGLEVKLKGDLDKWAS